MIINKLKIKFNFPKEVKLIFNIFKKKEIMLVGGCVRDLILEKKPKDFDFATIKTPDEIIKILNNNKIRYVETGRKFGTIGAIINGKLYEITTLRDDFDYDGRHCQTRFVDSYFLDSQRRDFTINALYLDSEKNIYDYHNSIKDLTNKKVQFIGFAQKRIDEDHLRILRYFRFFAQYSKEINNLEKIKNDNNLIICTQNAHKLLNISKERIRDEFTKILLIKNKNSAEILKLMQNLNIINILFNTKISINSYKNYLKFNKLNNYVKEETKFIIALIFLKYIKNFDEFFENIYSPKKEKNYLQNFIKLESENFNIDNIKTFYNLFYKYDKEMVIDFFIYKNLTKNSTNISKLNKNIKKLRKYKLKEFPIKNKNLVDLGFIGSKISIAYETLLNYWLINSKKPTFDKLINIARNYNKK